MSLAVRCRLAVTLCFSIASLTMEFAHAQDTNSRMVDLRIIVVASQEEAETVLSLANNGAPFDELARQRSLDATSTDGGEMGMVDPSGLRADLRDALKGVTPGHTTGIIKFPEGYAILKVVSESSSTDAQSADSTKILPMTAAGSLRYASEVGGMAEVNTAFRSYPKPEKWEQNLAEVCTLRKDAIAAAAEKLASTVSAAGDSSTAVDSLDARYALAQVQAYQGNMKEAIDNWQFIYQSVLAGPPTPVIGQLEEILAVAYLHKSEMENDVYETPGNLCLFPPQKNVHYKQTADSEKAIELFNKYLTKQPEDFEARWLLNLAYMTLGKYPEGVPAKYLVPPSAFGTQANVPHLTDVANQAGVKLFQNAGGVIVDDFENNGLLDIVTSSVNVCQQMHYFHNNGDGTFTDKATQAGLANQLGGLNMIQADYNNDGCVDILVLRGGWEYAQRKSLLRNNCDGTFTDVTRESGLAEPPTSTQTAVWVDLDNDGLLDLVVGNEDSPIQLFHNKGNGVFEEIAHAAGIDSTSFTKAVVAADYDNDGYADIYVSNLNGENRLYHNNHNLTFTEVGKKAGVQLPWRSFGAAFFDYNNDGWPDLFVTSYYGSVDDDVRSYLGMQTNSEPMKVYKNLGDGTFRDVTKELHADRSFMTMGFNFGDIDNDGYLDLYLGTGNPSYSSLVPNAMLRNNEGKSFVDVTAASGTGELHKGHAVAFADLERTGNEDMLTVIGGAINGDQHAFRLFENPGNGNDWINLKLIGVKTNRSAIGARIKVTIVNEGKLTRSIYRTVGSGGSFGASPLEQHIGLGKSAKIQSIEIWWPTSNTRQTFSKVDKNQFLEIKEFEKNYKKLERKSFHLGGASKASVSGTNPGTQGN